VIINMCCFEQVT